MVKKLFGSLVYESQDQYLKFIQELDQPQAVAMLVAAAAYAQGHGIYSMEESEVLINSIRKLVPAAKFEEMIQQPQSSDSKGETDGPVN